MLAVSFQTVRENSQGGDIIPAPKIISSIAASLANQSPFSIPCPFMPLPKLVARDEAKEVKQEPRGIAEPKCSSSV